MGDERTVSEARGGEEPDCYLKVRPDVKHDVAFLPCDSGEIRKTDEGMMVNVRPWGSDWMEVPANRTVHPPHVPEDARVLKRVRLPAVNTAAVLEGVAKIGRPSSTE